MLANWPTGAESQEHLRQQVKVKLVKAPCSELAVRPFMLRITSGDVVWQFVDKSATSEDSPETRKLQNEQQDEVIDYVIIGHEHKNIVLKQEIQVHIIHQYHVY